MHLSIHTLSEGLYERERMRDEREYERGGPGSGETGGDLVKSRKSGCYMPATSTEVRTIKHAHGQAGIEDVECIDDKSAGTWVMSCGK